ncbi:uncharacterized protein DUF3710 [Frondihabitans sp. PhB188]|uniref:DUF3710 domain-containing protein n=1 Tax=Frondihabitans sp. PhB188 TaxID=2485200 RepID=UPI000F4A7620|nr:DUF3710 domain-containing protein [Frondihabitans sp. PhB188]ROQ41106.1 uncharacterized protein DUF3710 [Frondihabitans sp. PhB188]
MSRKSRREAAEAEAVESVEVDAVEIASDDDAVELVEAEEAETSLVFDDKSAPADRAEEGPLDETEANPVRPYVDLGGVKIVPREGLHLRLEVEEGSKRVVAVGLDFAKSTLQVQPFAAPRSTGLWHEIRDQIADQIRKQGGTTSEVDGPFGPEIRAEIPVAAGAEATAGQTSRLARFVGVDGPRWFLRGVIAGDATVDPEAAEKIEELFRSVVVVRGTEPMPPRDLIPLHMPKSTPGDAGTTTV